MTETLTVDVREAPAVGVRAEVALCADAPIVPALPLPVAEAVGVEGAVESLEQLSSVPATALTTTKSATGVARKLKNHRPPVWTRSAPSARPAR